MNPRKKAEEGIPDASAPEEPLEDGIEGEATDTPPTTSDENAKARATMSMERELRRYVKQAGGLRKGLPQKAVDRVKVLMKKLKRTGKPAWDRGIVIPGFDAPTVAGITYPDLK